MYIIITKFGEIYRAERIKVDDEMAADDGLITIIDTENKKEYSNQEWIDIEFWQN